MASQCRQNLRKASCDFPDATWLMQHQLVILVDMYVWYTHVLQNLFTSM